MIERGCSIVDLAHKIHDKSLEHRDIRKFQGLSHSVDSPYFNLKEKKNKQHSLSE